MAVEEGPDWQLQVAYVAALSADADVKTLLGDTPRLYQEAPEDDSVVPYVTVGESQVLPDEADCIDGSIVLHDFHVWSETPDFRECKAIAATIWNVLKAAAITMASHRLVDLQRESLRTVRDPDGVTKHAILTIRAMTEPL